MKNLFTIFYLLIGTTFFAQTTLFSTDFEDGMPSNITIVDNDENVVHPDVVNFTDAWLVVPDPDEMTNLVAASTSYFTEKDSADRWLILPALTLGSFGNFLKWDARSQDPSFPDDYMVLVSTTDNQLSSFTDTIGNIKQESFEWTNREVNLSEKGFNGQTVHIAFVLRTYDGFKLYLDNLEVRKEDPVAVQNLNAVSLKVYPNPASDFIEIQSQNEIDNWTIVNSSGQIIQAGNEKHISVKDFNSGVYFLKYQSASNVGVVRFMKQ